ncbi:MAG: hypothetical protein IJ365_00405, partial [Clostridia bacterium]|nr:hypothetical protein [Clostridia bacterium]
MKSITNYIKKIQSSHTTKMWLVSYILILLVPIIFSFFSYYYVERSLSEKINETNLNSLKSSRTYMDNILDGIVSATITLSTNEEISALARASELPTSTQMYERNLTLADSNYVWRAHFMFDEFINNKYIYMPNTDTVYTGTILVESQYYYMRTYADYRDFDMEIWKEKVLNQNRPGFICIPGGDYTKVFYIYPTYNNKTNVQFITIVELDMHRLVANAAGDNSKYFFVQHDHDIITSQAFTPGQKEAIFDSYNIVNGQKELATIEGRMMLIKTASANNNLYYGFSIPSQAYRSEVNGARTFMWISSLVCILLALIIIVYLINKNNRPLELIANTLAGNEPTEQYNDAYQYISEAINRNLSEKAQYVDKLHKQHDILRENILTNMLYGKTNDKFTSSELLGMINVDMPHNMFVTIALCPGDLSGMFNDDKYRAPDAEKSKMAQFIISNILGEAIGERYTTETVTLNTMVIAIINYPDDMADRVNTNLTSIITSASELIEREFNFCIHAAISNPHLDLTKLNDAYNESVLCMEYALNSGSKILFFEEINSGENIKNIYSTEIESEIAQCLADKDYIKCKK